MTPDTSTLLTLCGFSFLAGFIDSIVGGGGLVQTPAILFSLPQYPVPTLLGTTKIPSAVGTLLGAIQYSRRVVMHWALLLPMMAVAFAAAFTGSWTLTHVPNTFMRPLALVILVGVFLYTLLKPDFGQHVERTLSLRQQRTRTLLMALLIGFYDGFFGPGTGSFLVLGLVGLLGFDFLRASAHAKWVNLSTNAASLIFFINRGSVLFAVAIPMAVANLLGAFVGVRLALLKGNGFIRVFFLCVIAATILRFAYDLWVTANGARM
ncbi:sulfite exporter TauE/SafE family protein [Fibrivirga algicola]|uniref:Probable membrane transporter protein n=1 Tax=Fibrivirga algicola TaxID=2950420 RepID=A0ABX0Q9A0_9BACT|nr:TSUP family transporter [Fibrivirga algicola]NID08650.1 TSUP family transporter [Fibrivirga algicola]